MSLHFTDKLASLKRLIHKLRSKSRKRHNEFSEKENYNVRHGKCSAPSRKDIYRKDLNVGDRERVWGGEDAEDIQHTISRHPELTAIPPSPERVGPGFSAKQEQLNNEAQQQDLSPPPPPQRRSTRSKTWESVKSVSVSSIRSVATVAQKALVCMPRLTRSESHIPPQFIRNPVVPRAEPGSQPEEITEEENDQLSHEVSHNSFAKSKHPTFPLDKSTMSDSTELATIRAKLKERERTSEYFNQIWEDEALPRLKETMVKGNITDYNISIQADYSEYGVLRIVEVVTRKRLPDNTNQELRRNVSKIFTPERSLHVTISFTIGVVKRTSGTEEPVNMQQPSVQQSSGVTELGVS
ncbi:hypothetical protein CFRS1_v015439 [Colletotrichum fructicola]|nr:hypothetical protein CFRS1_v015439 [Colletotrichum fructicola]